MTISAIHCMFFSATLLHFLCITSIAAAAATSGKEPTTLPSTPCTDTLTCQNGGSCVQPPEESNEDPYCYCNDLSQGQRFVGIDCATPAPKDTMDWCNENGDFCLHGGQCNHNVTSEHPSVCNCPEDYTGKFCELKAESHPESSCTLQCHNGGTCTHGYHKTPSIISELRGTTNKRYQHCQCPPGYMGRHCEEEVNVCGSHSVSSPHHAKQPEKQHYCHNGATCIDTKEVFGAAAAAVQPYLCNCTAAAEANPGQHFLGSHCEYSNVEVCDEMVADLDVRSFCANDGKCVVEEMDDETHYSCNCTAEFEGKHCEILKKDVLEATLSQHPHTSTEITVEYPGLPSTTAIGHPKVPHLNAPCQHTKCQNGGVCFSGAKDYQNSYLGTLMQRHPGDLHALLGGATNEKPTQSNRLNTMASNDYFEHCQCPTGYTGVHCETKFKVCEENPKMTCFRGSTCVEQGTKCSCNVDEYEDELNQNLAGKFCQYEATIQCGKNWCFNHATCDETNSYCQCKDGYYGPFCSFHNSTVFDDDDLLTESKLPEQFQASQHSNMIFISGIVAFAGIVSILGVVTISNYRNKKKNNNDDNQQVEGQHDEQALPSSVSSNVFANQFVSSTSSGEDDAQPMTEEMHEIDLL